AVMLRIGNKCRNEMKGSFASTLTGIFLAWFLAASLPVYAQDYYPPAGKWERKSPIEMGFNVTKLETAVQFARDNEYTGSRDLRIAILEGFQPEPYHEIVGPTRKRGGPAGLIIRNGYIVAEWGDIERVDMTFSVTKSYLSTVAGLAIDMGLINSVDDKMSEYVWDGTFEGEHNEQITWEHLLNQSSDWSGDLFGMRDWADRPPAEGGIDDWKNRKLNKPGTFYKYNDVRVNVLAYSLLQVWRVPLPQVLKEYIMDPIGASTTWRWYGYEDSWVNVDGTWVQSVSGGGHSGGGIFINSLDHARFGLLFLRKGKWEGQQLFTEEWIRMVTEPSPANESYGYMWWLSEDLYFAAGFGGNYIIICPDHDMVIVTRWLEPSERPEFIRMVKDAIAE
ncbi:MAG: serine hydrolase, partial [Bacteroidales bacterium]|nr:serine hydrolase [Bacteroidales bacterium]